MRALAIVLLAVVAAPLGAQVIPDEFPRPDEPLADRIVRDVEERYLGILTRFYSSTDAAASPAYGDFGAAVATSLEIGYQLRSGDAVSVYSTLETEMWRPEEARVLPVGGALGARYVLGLGRFADDAAFENVEVALGATRFTGFVSGTALDIAPRYAIPSGKPWRYVVGLQARHLLDESSDALPQRRWFVGPTFGVRFQYVPESRIILESSPVD